MNTFVLSFSKFDFYFKKKKKKKKKEETMKNIPNRNVAELARYIIVFKTQKLGICFFDK